MTELGQNLPAETASSIMREIGTRGRLMARAMCHILAGIALLAMLAWGGVVRAQEPPPTPTPQPSNAPAPLRVPLQEETQQSPTADCVQPPPMVSWEDYEGPYAKTVGVFARRLERNSVHPPHFKPGSELCTLETKDKLILFAQNLIDPVTFLSAGFNGGISQAENYDPQFGQGWAGYSKRFAANYVDQASGGFFKGFAFPTIFSEDPRYYRLGHGTGGERFLHALEHAVVTHREDGTQMFNFSEWLGSASAVALSNLYHPGAQRGFTPAAEQVSLGIANDAGFDVLREFWPEIAHKFKLPFRDRDEPTN